MSNTNFKNFRKPARLLFFILAFVYMIFYSLSVVGAGMVKYELMPSLISILVALTMSAVVLAIPVLYLLGKDRPAKILFMIFGTYLFVNSVVSKVEVAKNLTDGVSGAYATGIVFSFLAGLLGLTVIVLLVLAYLRKKPLVSKLVIILSLAYAGLAFLSGVILTIGYGVDGYPWYTVMGELGNSLFLPVFLLCGVLTILIPMEEELPPLFDAKHLKTALIVAGIVTAITYTTISAVGLSSYRISPYGVNAAAEKKDPTTGSHTANYYYSTDSSYGTISTVTVYNLRGKGDIAYVDFAKAYSYMFLPVFINSNYHERFALELTAEEDATYTLENSYGKITVDVFKDSITIHNYDPLMSPQTRTDDGINTSIIGGVESYNLTVKSTSRTLIKANNKLRFALHRYDIDLVAYKEVIYIPLATFADIFLNSNRASTAYNGKDIYLATGFSGYPGKKARSSLENKYYNDSPWNGRDRDGRLAKFTYNELCFYLDYFYGLKEFRGIKSFDTWITQLGLKNKLMSTSGDVYEKALIKYVCRYLSECHTSYNQQSPYVGNEDYYDYMKENYSHNARYTKISDALGNKYLNKRKAAGKDVGLTFSGNTAIIRFDAFTKMSSTSGISSTALKNYSYKDVHDADTYLFFVKAYEEIKAKGNTIKNIVIDLTVNGGGAVAAVPYVLALMTPTPKLPWRNRLTGELTEIVMQVDFNRDGKWGDDYSRTYEFFMMTSCGSFSCGNALPTYVKYNKCATLIGEKSGGGGCCVGVIVTASGSFMRSSDNLEFGLINGFGQFINNDGGITPKYEFYSKYWYDDAAINKFVNAHQKEGKQI